MEMLSLAIIVALAIGGLVWWKSRTHIVNEYERGVKYVRGRLVAVLPAGRYHRLGSTRIENVDIRAHVLTIPGQEVISQDNVALKLSVAVRLRVADPKVSVLTSQEPLDALYQFVQLALREIVGGAPLEDLLARRNELGQVLRERTEPEARRLGLEIEVLNLKDLIFPGPLKTVFAQVAVAKQEGLATLERARGESAALRNLANAAQLVEKNPALLQLRWLQALSAASGNKLVVNLTGASPAQQSQTPQTPQTPQTRQTS